MLDIPRQVPPARVRCRPIEEADLDAVVALLLRGFEDRSEDYWRRGLARHVSRPLPAGCPRYGFMLENAGRAVGVLLTLYSASERDGRTVLRCNLSSWYVEPGFRTQAAMLDALAQRRKDVTYLNVTPSPHTFALQEARGFSRFCQGQVFAVPALSRVPPGVSACLAGDDDPLLDLPASERRMVRDHAGYGCVCLVVTRDGASQPVIVLRRGIGLFRRKIGGGAVPCFQLFYCRDIADLPNFLGAVGRRLLRRFGIPWMVVDAAAPIEGLVGRYFEGRAPKYCRGPDPVPLGDLRYTELALFGP